MVLIYQLKIKFLVRSLIQIILIIQYLQKRNLNGGTNFVSASTRIQQITDVVNGRMSITPPDNNSPRYNRTRNDERRD